MREIFAREFWQQQQQWRLVVTKLNITIELIANNNLDFYANNDFPVGKVLWFFSV